MNRNFTLLTLLILALGVFLFPPALSAQVFNDGPVYVKVVAKAGWSNADFNNVADDPFEYTWIVAVKDQTQTNYTNIKTFAHDNGGHQWTTTSIADAWGVTLYENTFTGTNVPEALDYYFEAFENDCGDRLVYDCCMIPPPFDFCPGIYDNARIRDTGGKLKFRSAPENTPTLFQITLSQNNETVHAVLLEVTWRYTTTLPPMCSNPTGFFDGNMTLIVDIDKVWSDSNYDGNNLGGDEELVMRWTAKHDLQGSYPPMTFYNATQPNPRFNTQNNSGTPTNIINATFSPGMAQAPTSFSFQAYAFEDDIGDPNSYNGDSLYYDPFDLVYDTDDNLAQCGDNLLPCTFNVNFRSSPPNTDNYIDFPLKYSTREYGNWTIRLRYRWNISTPTVSIQPVGASICQNDPYSLSLETNGVTYYQWQVSDVSDCAQAVTWTNISGANCRTYDVPTNFTGTKAYRCVLMNRTGTGMSTPYGSPINTVFSNCTTVTRNPDSPAITGPCGQTLTQGSRGIFSVPTNPAASYTWSVSGAGNTIFSGQGTNNVEIIFASTGTVTLDINYGSCGSRQVTCNVTIDPSPDCDYIFVAPNAPNGAGTPSAPTNITHALGIATPTRNHIRLLEGDYNLTQKLTLPNIGGLTVEGGYRQNNGIWEKSTSSSSTLNLDVPLETFDPGTGTIGHYIGIEATLVSGFTLRDLVINVKNGGTSGTASGTTNQRGRSVYGIRLSTCNNYLITRCTINTGAGTAGDNGIAGANGSNGTGGTNGDIGDCDNYQEVGDGGAGGAGGGGTAGGAQNVDNTTVDPGINGGIGQNSGNGRAGGGGGAGGSGGSTPQDGGNGGNGGEGGGGITGGSGGLGGLGSGLANQKQCDLTCTCTNITNPVRIGNTGSNGTTGANGSGLAPGIAPGHSYVEYFIPSLQSRNGQDGRGGSGGGGGGGGAGEGHNICNPFWALAGAGGGGGGGGGGGEGGEGGKGGFGGGGSFGLYLYNNGSNGRIKDCRINVGSGGTGGTGGVGGIGGSGGNGGIGGAMRPGSNCFGVNENEAGIGGAGGNGGDGGSGANGENGLAGVSESYRTQSGTPVIVNGNNTVPNPTNVTLGMNRGCSYSEITLSKAGGGNWDIMGGGLFVPNLSDGQSSSSPTVNNISIYYPDQGTVPVTKDIALGTDTLAGYITLRQNRPLPEITSPNANLTICSGNTVTLNTVTTSNVNTWSWEIIRVSTPNSPTNPSTPIYSSNVQNPGNVTLTTPNGVVTTYQIKLKVMDNCCGWSIPVYRTVVVSPIPTVPQFTQAPLRVCSGQSGVAYTVQPLAGATFNWTVTGGGIVTGQTGPDNNQITINWNGITGTPPQTPINATIRVSVSLNGCTSRDTTINVTVRPRPQLTFTMNISPSNEMCANDLLRVVATDANQIADQYKFIIRRGGNITDSTDWQASNIYEITNLATPNPATSYTISVDARSSTDAGLCGTNPAPTAEAFTVYRLLTASLSASATTICIGQSVTFTATSTPNFPSAEYLFYKNNPNNPQTNWQASNTYITSNVADGDVIGVLIRYSPAPGKYCNSNPAVVTIRVSGNSQALWTGIVDKDWFKPENWFSCTVPDCNIDVTIPVWGIPNDPNPNYPIVVQPTGVPGFMGSLTPARAKNVTVQSGAHLTIDDNSTLEVCGDLVNEANATIANSGINAVVSFVGTANTVFRNAGTTDFDKISMNKINNVNTVTIESDLITKDLILLKGKIISQTTNEVVRVTRPAPDAIVLAQNSDNPSHIVGKLIRKIGTSAGTYVYPVGTSSFIQQAELDFPSAPSGIDEIQAEFRTGTPTGLPTFPLPQSECAITNYQRTLNNGYWKIDAFNSSGVQQEFPSVNYNLVLQNRDYSNAGSYHTAIKKAFGQTNFAITGTCDVSSTDDYTTRIGMSGFSEFVTLVSDDPLALGDITLKAVSEGSRIRLEWTVAHINSDSKYTLYRKTAISSWQDIHTVSAQTMQEQGYVPRFSDFSTEANQTYFYQLIEKGTDGQTVEKSNIAQGKWSSYTNLPPLNFRIYPNPVSDDLYIEPLSSQQQPVTIQMYNEIGQVVYTKSYDSATSEMVIPMRQMTSGIYLLQIKSGNQTHTQKIIKP